MLELGSISLGLGPRLGELDLEAKADWIRDGAADADLELG